MHVVDAVAALQAATVAWWLFVGALSMASLAIIGVNLRMWRGPES